MYTYKYRCIDNVDINYNSERVELFSSLCVCTEEN